MLVRLRAMLGKKLHVHALQESKHHLTDDRTQIPLAVFTWRYKYGTSKNRRNKADLGLYPRDFSPEFWQGTKFEPDPRSKYLDALHFKAMSQSPHPELPEGGIREIVRVAGTDSDDTGTDEQNIKDPRGGKRKGAGEERRGAVREPRRMVIELS